MDEQKLWEKTAAFHGHECGGLAIGFKAALYALEVLGVPFEGGAVSRDEELVCVSENDACGVDAIQAVLGCTAGKGNLLFHLRGKQAFSFYSRKSGASVRLVLRPGPAGMSRAEALAYYRGRAGGELFEAKPAALALPPKAPLFGSAVCCGCGETVGEAWLRRVGGKPFCLDCCPPLDRYHV